jgi:cell division protein FtsL
MGARLLIAVFLFSAVATSGLALAYSKHLGRQASAQLRILEREADELTAEWARLQLEESARASHGRIERTVREQLHMRMPTEPEIWVVTP